MFDPLQALQEYVRHPSVSTDPSFQAGMVGARDFIADLLRQIGLTVEIVPTPRHPAVLATRGGRAEWPHIVIYGHYDVQPEDPRELWQSPPFEPTIRQGRLFARGAADNKGPLLAHVAALGRLLEKQPNLPLRLTILVEGEEEINSPSFPQLMEKCRDRLQGDFILLSDTLSPTTSQIAVTCGLRGITTVNIEMTGPRMDLHSGIHGGVLLNPIQALTELLASLHDTDGRVAIPGFYDAVVPMADWERQEIARLPGSNSDYAAFLGIDQFHTFDGFSPREATRGLPTLEINGIGGGYQGAGHKTVIPSRAMAKISCRLVANQDPEAVQNLLVETLRDRVSSKVKMEIERGPNAHSYRVVPPGREGASPDLNPHLARAFQATDRAITRIFGLPPLYLREGGSVPIIADLKRVTGMDSLMIGLFTPEDNLHAPNESMDLGMFERGIEAVEAILEETATGR